VQGHSPSPSHFSWIMAHLSILNPLLGSMVHPLPLTISNLLYLQYSLSLTSAPNTFNTAASRQKKDSFVLLQGLAFGPGSKSFPIFPIWY